MLGERAGDRSASRIEHLLAGAAARWPHRPAVKDGRGTSTYAQLYAESSAYVDILIAQGVRPGDRVLVRALPERWVLALIDACARVGAVAVPLAPDLPKATWAYVRENAEAVLEVHEAPVAVEGGGPTATTPVAPEAPTVSADVALFLYTSGSTAHPKAVVCPHAQVMFALRAVGERLGYQPDDVVFCRLPLSFDYGLYQWFLTAAAGATLVLHGPGGDAGLMVAVRQHAATVVPLVPSLATILVRLGARGPAPTVRLLTNTGQELHATTIAALREVFPHAAVQLMYGTTECKRVTIGDPDDDVRFPGAVGRPLPGTHVEIVNEHERPVPPGTDGQIVVAGPHVMSGYWGDDALTRQVFRTAPETDERRLFTGDYGKVDHAGRLYFSGRRDHMFKIRGMRTGVAEIEAAATRVRAIEQAAVIPPTRHRDAVLFVVAPGLTAARALELLRAELEPTKIPADCRIVPALPLNGNGKTDRAALERLLASGENSD